MADNYEEYNYDQEKYLHAGSGKHRSKKESSEHTNHFNPGGHERKIATKFQNCEANKKTKGGPGTSPPKS